MISLVEVMEQFPTQQHCIDFLESIRFKDGAYCPHCGSVDVAKKSEKNHIGRWNCHDCKSSFKVTKGTVFHGTQIPLQKWFLAIILMNNAKKSLSSCQLARDLNIPQKGTWYMMQRIRSEMASKNDVLLKGIIEADETYIGGKPRKTNKRSDDNDDENKNKRGRGTKKSAVLGAVERGGKVVAEAVSDLTGKGILNFILNNVNPVDSRLITDEYPSYKSVDSHVNHDIINHSEQYVDGDVHTNTIEGFWGLLKRAWYGQHHHYKKQYLPLYVAEACYKYNNRKREDVFDYFVRGCFA